MKKIKLTRKLQNFYFAILIIVTAFAVIVSCENNFITAILPLRDKNVTANEQPQKEVYNIVIDISGNASGDTVTVSPVSGSEGDSVTLAYAVANTAHYNLLDFGGVTAAITSVNGAGSGTETYTIDPADSSNGVITITAIFTHTDLTPDPIAFTDVEGHIAKTYGDAFTNAVTAAHSGSGAITYSSGDETVAVVDGSGRITLLKVGSAIITAEKAADAVYAHAQKNYTLTVNPKPVTITGLSASNKTYDGAAIATVTGTAVIDGLAGGDDVTVAEGTAEFEDSRAGTGKTVTFGGYSLDGVDAGNYTLIAQPESVTADIEKKSVIITGLSAANKLYDGAADAVAVGTAAIGGLISEDDVTIVDGTAAFTDKNVGSNKTVTFSSYSLEGDDAGNYNLSAQPESVTADILLSGVLVTITGLSAADKEYDGATTATVTGTAALSGLVSGDAVTAVAGTAAFADAAAGTGKTVTFSGWSLGGADVGNYTLSSQPASVTADITAKLVTIDGLSAADKTYDGATTATAGGIAVISGLIGGNDVTVSAGTAAFANKTVGTGKTVTFSGYSLGGADAGNYSLSSQPANVTANITVKSVTITGLSAANKVYDGTTNATVSGTAVISGLISGDAVTVSAGTAAFANKTVGTGKTVTFSGYSLGGADAGNYSLSSQPASVTANITVKTVTITGLSASNKVYDGNTTATITGTAALNGLVSGDTVTLGGTRTSVFDNKNVGTGKTVTVSGYTISGADTGNYSLTQPSVTANITVKSVTITGLSAANKQYDGTTTATVNGTATISGLVGGDAVIVSAGTAAFASAVVGTGKTVTFSGYSLGGADVGNYSLSAQPANVTANIEYVSMVQISGGTFQMGKDLGTAATGDRTPVHDVTLSGFYMGKYEVTQALYQLVMGSNPSNFMSSPASGEVQNKRPVESVSWYDAIVFCNKLSVLEGLTPAYRISGSTDPATWGTVPTSSDSTWNTVEIVSGSTGYRLPTEAQWEYAAKGGNPTAAGWVGYTYSGGDNPDSVAWYTSNSGSKTHEVGTKSANRLGLYDMSGNVYEWCWDWYGSYQSGAQNNPLGAVSGSSRVDRGGWWGNLAEYVRSAYRNGIDPYSRSSNRGFRLARP